MQRGFDVVVVGGGVMGSAVAYALTANRDFTGTVLVVEKDLRYEYATTARSVGGIRQQFSTPENVDISIYAREFIRDAGRTLAVDGDAPDLSFKEQGYLFLCSAAGLDILKANHAVQRERGATVSVLSAEELEARFPWMNTADLAAGSFGPINEGWIDPYALLQAFKRKATSLGARYVQDEVVGLERSAHGICGVRTRTQGIVPCGALVNTAGPRAADIARMAGFELPVRPRKRQVFVFECRERIADSPLVIDPTGMYFRPEGERFLCGISPDPEDDADCYDGLDDVDYGPYEETLWPLLAHRVSAFEAIKLSSAWACLYDYNTFDQNAIVGAHPDIENLYLANGFSGHGLQQSPAMGRAISELLVHGAYRTLDLSRFGFARIAAGKPIHEVNVV